MNKQRLKTIIEKIQAGTATADEISEINRALEQDEDNKIAEEIHTMLNQPEDGQYVYDEAKWDIISKKILQADKLNSVSKPVTNVTRLITKLSIAAAVLVA